MKKSLKQHIFFVDDETGIRIVASDALRQLGCKVTCFEKAADCLRIIADSNCTLIITDVKMPEIDGLALLSRAKKIAPWIPVMVITGYGDIPMAVRAMKLGAVDFIEKPFDRALFLRKVQTTLEKTDFQDSVSGKNLTKTERTVLKLILQGKSNKQIAYKLDRAVRTVELHRSNIMHKFNVDSIVDLVKKAAPMDL